MRKSILLIFVFSFLLHFPLASSYELVAQTDSVFDASELEGIEGLDDNDEDSELEDEFGDLSGESGEDNFDAEDFEIIEEDLSDFQSEDKTDSKVLEEALEEDFDKDDYEELSDKPGYEVISDEELEKEFLEEEDKELEDEEDRELEDEEDRELEDEEGMELEDEEDRELEDEEDRELEDEEDRELEDEEDRELEDEEDRELEDEEDRELEDEEDRELEDEEDRELEDEEGMELEDEEDRELEDEEDIKKDIENMERSQEELEQLEEEIEQVDEGQGEGALDLEESDTFEDSVIEGFPAEEEPADLSSLNLITNIRYLAEKDQIVIDSSEIASYQERNNSQTNQLIIEILQSKLGENLHWPYVLRDFNTDFGLIKADQKDSSTVRVLIQLKEGAGFPRTTLSQDGNQIIIGYGDIVNNEIVSEEEVTSSSADIGSILPAKTLEDLYFGNIQFSGTPVSFHVIDAPIKQVLRFISEESGLNMVIDETVSGTVTLKLEDVPWDQALHTIFKVKSLGYTRDGNVITILPLAKIEARTKKLKEISDRQKSLSPFETKVIPIMYAKASDIAKQVKEFSTPAGQGVYKGGRIIVHEESNTLVVVDTAVAVKKITAMAQFLDKAPKQVMIEAKIVEVSKSFARNFGFNWSLGGDLPVRINASGFLDFFRSAFDGISGSYQASSQKGEGVEGAFAMNGLPFIGDVNATLNLAENDGSVQILSTIKALTKSGQSASITKNTPILIPASTNTVQEAGGATTGTTGAVGAGGVVTQETFQTQDITLSLQVTPIVTSSGSIAIQVDVNLGDPGGAGGAFKTDRTAQTEVLAKNGQTVVVSGIYQKSETQTNEGVPFIGKVPLLGWLFSNESVNAAESEMLMFITPTLVE